MVYSSCAPWSYVEIGETNRRTTITVTLHRSGRYGKTQSSLQCRPMKTQLDFAKKHLKDPQTVRNNIIWLSQIVVIPVKCAGSSLMLWGCFSAAGTERLVRVEEKLNAPKYWDCLHENPVQSIQNLGQPDNDPKHTARVACRQLCECPWVAQPQPEHEPNQIFLKKPENVPLPSSNLTELERWRGEEKNGR